jgi:hypothetical protein
LPLRGETSHLNRSEGPEARQPGRRPLPASRGVSADHRYAIANRHTSRRDARAPPPTPRPVAWRISSLAVLQAWVLDEFASLCDATLVARRAGVAPPWRARCRGATG